MPFRTKEQAREHFRRYQKENGERLKECQRWQHILREYGLTRNQFEAMLNEQNGECACCGNEAELVVDHDHKTGKVRGLLCQPCNKSLGIVSESEVRLLSLVTYIRKHT